MAMSTVWPDWRAYGLGVIFRIQLQPKGVWKLKVLHAFTGGDDGATGSAGRSYFVREHFTGRPPLEAQMDKALSSASNTSLGMAIQDALFLQGTTRRGLSLRWTDFRSIGQFVCTTYYDGANDFGSVYQLSPQPDGTWSERVLYSFKGGKDGLGSISNLVLGKNGALYGTTTEGGAGCSCGTIFKLTSDGQGNWKETPAIASRVPQMPLLPTTEWSPMHGQSLRCDRTWRGR